MGTEPVTLKDAYKTFTLDQDKIISPEETIRKFKEKLNKLDLNILKETIRIDNGRLGIPVYISVCGEDARAVTGTKKQMGKGATPQQAEASAVMELAERFSFFSFCNQPANFITAPYDALRERAIPFPLIAQSVHDESEDLTAAKGIFESIPLRWTAAYDLTDQRPVMIPFNWFFTINEFNGPCAGNCIEEALVQGICEIVERHVSGVISQRRLSVPTIRPESAGDPMVVEMLGKFRVNGIRLCLSDFTLDMGIPSVGALAYDPSTIPEKSEIVWTAGTTPDPQKALSRALTEVAQLAGDFNSASNYVASGLPKFRTLADAEYVTEARKQVDITDLPDLSDANIKIEVQNCLAALSRKGMNVIVVDVMHPLLQIPAFYTIIPGAHFRERAMGTSVGMFAAKLITETFPPREAVRRLEAFEKKLSGKYFTMFYLGTAHLNLDRPDDALEYLRKALERKPNSQDLPSVYVYMGICYKDMAQYRKALEVLGAAETLDPERTDVYNLMGFCHYKLKEHGEAIDCFEKVLALDPTSAIDYANIASNYRDMGDTKKAIQYYEAALARNPEIDFARENLQRLKGSRS